MSKPVETVKAFYTVAELAAIAGLSKKTVLRMLRVNGVRTFPANPTRGHTIHVSFKALMEGMPDLLLSRAAIERIADE